MSLQAPGASGDLAPEPGWPTVASIEALLRRHVLEPWFPRCLDLASGGYLCDFDQAWNAAGPQDRNLAFQARQSWVAAELLPVFPGAGLQAAMDHGLRYLQDQMWDRRHGGWFDWMSRSGEPLKAETKHAHGMAYAISAFAAAYAATGEPAHLAAAQEGFRWVDAHAHDTLYGGYHGFLTRDGRVIASAAENPLRLELDTIGAPIGCKDANTQSDMLEALTLLHRVWPDDRVAERLVETVHVLSQRMVLPEGRLMFLCRPDWTPVPHLIRYGYAFQTARRLLKAGESWGRAEALAVPARRMLNQTLRHAWDGRARGGFFFAGPATGPRRLEGQDLVVRRKSWWVQFEAAAALLEFGALPGAGDDYRDGFASHWSYIARELLDETHGGVFAGDGSTRKGDAWKDASHEARAWLSCRSVLAAGATS